MKTNWVRAELKARGKAAFKRNYWLCVLAAIIGVILGGGSGQSFSSGSASGIDNIYLGISPQVIAGILMAVLGALIIALILNIFVFQPLYTGVSRFFLINTGEKARLGEILYAFKNGNYWNVVKTKFLTDLYIVLWSCLLLVPGIIKMYSYRMVPYILAENPQMPTKEIIDRSRQMMDGNKWKAFVLDISFIGWYFLSAITLGIVGVFYASPYIMATNAELYLAISGRDGEKKEAFFDDLNGGNGGIGNEPHYEENYASQGSLFDDFKEEEKDAGLDDINDDIFHNGDAGHSGTKLNGKEL